MTATILVVDDEPDLEALVLQKFRKQIRDGAVQFVFARDGIEALASIEAHPHVDLVVSDINMPRMDGLSLLQKEAHGGVALQPDSNFLSVASVVVRTSLGQKFGSCGPIRLIFG